MLNWRTAAEETVTVFISMTIGYGNNVAYTLHIFSTTVRALWGAEIVIFKRKAESFPKELVKPVSRLKYVQLQGWI